MKKVLILVMVIFALTSCSKDSFDLGLSKLDTPEKSEIIVRVSYLVWTGNQSESGCVSSGIQEVTFLANAKINLYEGGELVSDSFISPMMSAKTNNAGSSLFEDLEPGLYTVTVETALGEKTRTLTTQLNRRSSIDFSF